MGVQGGVIQRLGLEVTVYACDSDHIVFQLLQGISCLSPLDSLLASVVDADLSIV